MKGKIVIILDIVVTALLIISYLITKESMSTPELSGRLLAAGPHMAISDILTIIVFLLTRVILILVVPVYFTAKISNHFLKKLQPNE